MKNFFQAQGYPTPLSSRSGCRVGWLTFATRKEAERASKVACKDARRQEALGYYWGYMSPGSIEELKDGTFEVCIP